MAVGTEGTDEAETTVGVKVEVDELEVVVEEAGVVAGTIFVGLTTVVLVLWVVEDEAGELEAELVETVVDDEWLLVLVVVEVTGYAVAIVWVVTVVVVVLDPATHFPFTKIKPNLLEQLLQATPLSL